MQGHDSLLMSVHPEDAWKTAKFLKASLERPLTYDGVDLVIPTEIKLGRRWGCGTCAACRVKAPCTELVEFKRFPSRDEFEAAVARLKE
jgi:hypothetical protein